MKQLILACVLGVYGIAQLDARPPVVRPRFVEEARLLLSALPSPDGAGPFPSVNSLAISGDTLIVGARAPYDFIQWQEGTVTRGAGAAHVFIREQAGLTSVWREVATLAPTDPEDFDFGHSVAIEGDLAIVGVSNDRDSDIPTGAAYIYARNQGGPNAWGEVARLTAGEDRCSFNNQAACEYYSFFGKSVAISGNVAVVGAPAFSSDGDNNGPSVVYIFERNAGGPNAWGRTARFATDDVLARLGAGVAVSGDTVIVGAPGDSSGPPGTAYVFARKRGPAAAWRPVATWTAPGSVDFGWSVAFTGDTALIQSSSFSESGGWVEQAHVYSRTGRTTWRTGAVLQLTDPFRNGPVSIGVDLVSVGRSVFQRASPTSVRWRPVDDVTVGDSGRLRSYGVVSTDTLAIAGSSLTNQGKFAPTIFIFVSDADGDGVRDEIDECPTDPSNQFKGRCEYRNHR